MFYEENPEKLFKRRRYLTIKVGKNMSTPVGINE